MIVRIEHKSGQNVRLGQVLNDNWIVEEVLTERHIYTTVRLDKPGFTKLESIRDPTLVELLAMRKRQIEAPPPQYVVDFLYELDNLSRFEIGVFFRATLLPGRVKVCYNYKDVEGGWATLDGFTEIVEYSELRPLFHSVVSRCRSL